MIVYLYSKSNDTQIFSSKEDAFKELGFSFIAESVGLYIGSMSNVPNLISNKVDLRTNEYRNLCSWGTQKIFGDFCLRNEYGDILTLVDFREQILGNKKPYVPFNLKGWNGEGPVPGTGRAMVFTNCYRNPRNLGALRAANCYYEEEGEVPVRAKRSKNYLADIWNRGPRNTYLDRNWKRNRKTQYK